jgi:hypothetical protein
MSRCWRMLGSVLVVGGLWSGSWAQEPPALDDPAASTDAAALRARIAEITVADVAWRAIPWKTCLLDGLATAQREHKPILVWCQIDRPIDDTRC